jgi:hypothetical protein
MYAAEQSPDFGDHLADMPVLPIIDPLPAIHQPQIQSQLVQICVGAAQVALARGPALAARFE